MFRQGLKREKMCKRVLMVATVPSMIGQFNMNNIHILHELGYEVDVAADFTDTSYWPMERIVRFKSELERINVRVFQLDFSRSILDFSRHNSAYKKAVKLVQEQKYSFIHTHTPVASAIMRLVAHKTKTPIVYTAHGFHFYSGSPKKNWILFYPVEKILSNYTDVLITINNEDYHRALNKFKANKTVYIPGVGFETKRFRECNVDREIKRTDLGLRDSDFLLLSVGELSERKNQIIVIEALHILSEEKKINNIVYLIVGKGELEDRYKDLIKEYKLESHIKIEGYRQDIPELCKAADCFIHPSVREGLGIAPLEAMAAGLPLISSYVNGIKDYSKNEVSGLCINPNNAVEVANSIFRMYSDKTFRLECGERNIETAMKFDIEKTNAIMKQVYTEMN